MALGVVDPDSSCTVQSFDINALGEEVVLGCDFVGEVVELGSNVTKYAKGDIIARLIWGGKCVTS